MAERKRGNGEGSKPRKRPDGKHVTLTRKESVEACTARLAKRLRVSWQTR